LSVKCNGNQENYKQLLNVDGLFVHLYSTEAISNARCIRINVNWITYRAISDPKSIFAIISNGRFVIIDTIGMIFWFLLQDIVASVAKPAS